MGRLSLQPFDGHLDGKDGDLVMAKNLIDLALPKSPDSRFLSTLGGHANP